MEEVPYEMWVDYIEEILKRHKGTCKMILDLGCGTGEVTTLLAKKGYSMIGVDGSMDMLLLAKEKALKEECDILYLRQDMTEFELYGTVGAVISTCDSLNYLLSEEDLLTSFKLVDNYLDPGGLFIFDMNTEYKFKEVLGNNSFGDNTEEFSYIWNNYYYEEDEINEYQVTMFMKEDNHYIKYEEIHYEKMYRIEEVKKLLEEAGLIVEGVYGEGTFNSPDEKSERIYFVAREQKKRKKLEEKINNE